MDFMESVLAVELFEKEDTDGKKFKSFKIYHHNDLDGRCAGAIAFRCPIIDKSPLCQIHEVSYSDSVDFSDITKDTLVFVVDFSFKRSDMEELIKKAGKLIWIDHHQTAIDTMRGMDIPGIAISGEGSGCALTWRYCFGDAAIPRSVALISDFDEWKFEFGNTTRYFKEGLLKENTDPKSNLWDSLFSDNYATYQSILKDGIICFDYKRSVLADYLDKYSFEVIFEGRKCLVLNFYYFGSESFGDKIDEYDICIGFVQTDSGYQISLYSKKLDVGVLAKKYGGGGHVGAAGFTTNKLPFKPVTS